MLFYRCPRMFEPEHLQGLPLARNQGEQYDYLAIKDAALLLPPPPDVRWVPCKGFDVCLSGSFDPKYYMRETPWSSPIACRDGNGTTWILPVLLSPEGLPVCDLRIVMDEEGTLSNRPVDDRQARAIDAAIWARQQINNHGDLHMANDIDLTNAALSIIESAYHLSAEVVTRLGVLTISGRRDILRVAAGAVASDG